MEIIALLVIVYGIIFLQEKLFQRMAFVKLDYICDFSVNEAHEGDEIYLIETVNNRKLLPVPWLKVHINSSRWLYFAGTTSVVTQDSRYVTSNFVLKGRQRTTRKWKLRCLKRGVFTTRNVTLVSGDLLNLNSVSLPVDIGKSLVVYPQVINLEEYFVPADCLTGDTIVKRWIIDDPFVVAGTREYAPGDPMNRIEWNATARTGNIMVRKNDFTAQFSYTVILNVQSIENEYYGTVHKDMIELGIKAAATILDRALSEGIPVRLASNGCVGEQEDKMIFTNEASGSEHVRELLKILAGLELKAVRDFEFFLDTICGNLHNTEVVFITGYVNEILFSTVRYLKSKGNRVSVMLLDYAEKLSIPGDINVYMLSGQEEANAG